MSRFMNGWQRIFCLAVAAALVFACVPAMGSGSGAAYAAVTGFSGENTGGATEADGIAGQQEALTIGQSSFTVATNILLNSGLMPRDLYVELRQITRDDDILIQRREYFTMSETDLRVEFNHVPQAYYYFVVGSNTDPFYPYNGRYLGQTFYVNDYSQKAPVIRLDTGYTVNVSVELDNGEELPADCLPRVYLYQREWKFIDRADVQDGKAVFKMVPNGENYFFYVDSSKDNYFKYNGKELGRLFSVNGSSMEAPPILLDAGHNLSIPVKLNNGEELPAGVKPYVTLYRWDGSKETKISSAYVQDGKVVFKMVPDGENYYFHVGSFYGKYFEYDGKELGRMFSLNDESREVPPILLDVGHTLSVPVKLDNGEELSDDMYPYVSLYQWDGTRSHYISGGSFQDGKAVFKMVPNGENYYFHVNSSTGNYFKYNGKELGRMFSLNDESREVPPILLDTGHTLSVPVKLDNGEELPADSLLRVYLYQRDGKFKDWAYVQDGKAVFKIVPDGDFYFYVSSDYANYFEYDGKELGRIFTVNDESREVPPILLEKAYTVSAPVKLDNGNELSNNDRPDVRLYRWDGAQEVFIQSVHVLDRQVLFKNLHAGSDYYFVCNEYNGREQGKTFSIPTAGEVPAILLSSDRVVQTKVTLNGRPVADARVQLFRFDEKNELHFGSTECVTDSDGIASFMQMSTLNPGEKYYFYVFPGTSHAEYIGWMKNKTFVNPSEAPGIELDEGINIASTVQLDGVPIKGVPVFFYRIDDPAPVKFDYYVYSDENGRVEFDGLTPGAQYYFMVNGTHKYLEYDGRDQPFKPDVNPPRTIELSSGESFSTTVTFQGKPVPWIKVELRDRFQNSVYARASTDENGVATFSLLGPGDYYLSVQTPDYVYDGKLRSQSFKLPGAVPNIELEESQSIEVRVILDPPDAAQPDQTGGWQERPPIILKYRMEDNTIKKNVRPTRMKKLDDSTYLCIFEGLTPWDRCTFYVSRVAGQNAYYDGLESGQVFSIPGTAADIHLEQGQTGSVRVTLNGEPQQNVLVEIPGLELVYEETDANGVAVIKNLPTADRLYFAVESYDGRFANYNGANKGLFFSSSDSAYPAIELEKGSACTVRVRKQGRPVPEVRVLLEQKDSAGNFLHIAQANTDAGGNVVFHNITPGKGYLFAVLPGKNASTLYSDQPDANRTLPANVTLEIDPNYHPDSSGSGDSGDSGGSSGSGSGGSPFDWLASLRNPTAQAPATGTLSARQAADRTAAAMEAAKKTGGKTAAVRLKNIGSLSLEAARAMVNAADGFPLQVQADSTLNNGTVVVRLAFDPAGMTLPVDLTASTGSSRATSIQTLFGKWFKNRIQVVSFGQQDSFGMPVEVAVLLDRELNAEKLCFYSYDREGNTYQQLVRPNHWLDTNGYIHFTTQLAGDLLITDMPLQKK